jgi:hypothetical protein
MKKLEIDALIICLLDRVVLTSGYLSMARFIRCPAIFAFIAFGLCACKSNSTTKSLKPLRLQQEQTITLEVGDLKIVFVDNTAFAPDHRAGYNGIASMRHREEDSTLFVPYYAGFNLEHIFGGDTLAQLFEPRRHPMSLFKKSESEVVLYQEPTPLSDVESVTEFSIVPPHYIDITFRCILHSNQFFKHGYAGLFWASYIHRPDDKKIYFIGTEGGQSAPAWIGAYSEEHGVESTHRSVNDAHELFFDENFNARLANHYSDYRYSEPFYFGRFREMAFAYLFDPKSLIRFSQSPTGGGDTNPAWDFQFIIPTPERGKVYSFKARLIYKRFVSAEDIRDEFKKWSK